MNDDYVRQHIVATPGVSHYYGDVVRQLFIAASAVMLIGAPFYGDSLSIELPFVIMGVLVLVALGALSSPHNSFAIYGNAIAAGIGLVIYESWALLGYEQSSWIEFTLRQLVAVIFLAAFYFSMKTVRALVFNQIGKHDEAGEFDRSSSNEQRAPRDD